MKKIVIKLVGALILLAFAIVALFTLSACRKEIKGDLNEDGKVDENDVELLQDYLSTGKKDFPGDPDVNEDGKVNIQDLTELLNIIDKK